MSKKKKETRRVRTAVQSVEVSVCVPSQDGRPSRTLGVVLNYQKPQACGVYEMQGAARQVLLMNATPEQVSAFLREQGIAPDPRLFGVNESHIRALAGQLRNLVMRDGSFYGFEFLIYKWMRHVQLLAAGTPEVHGLS